MCTAVAARSYSDKSSKDLGSAGGRNLSEIRSIVRRFDSLAALVFHVDATFQSLGSFLQL